MKPISLVLALISIHASATPTAPFFAITGATIASVEGGADFYYYDRKDRLRAVSDLCSALETDYSLWDLKRERLGVDGKTICRSSLRAEADAPAAEDVGAQAQANLEFLDRTLAIGASFRDTHLTVTPLRPRDLLLLPFDVTRIDAKFYITMTAPKLLAFMAQQSDSEELAKISKGDELIQIDGLIPEHAIDLLKPYVSASSAGAQDIYSTEALTQRDFRYPASSTAIVTLRKKDGTEHTFEIPWFYSAQPLRPDVDLVFKARGYRSYQDLRMRWDDKTKKWSRESGWWDGYAPEDLPEGGLSIGEYSNSDGDRTVLSAKYFVKDARAVALLQVNSFNEEQACQADDCQPFLDALRGLIKTIKDAGTPLILDLRNNPGGNSLFPPALLSMLAPEGARYARIPKIVRVTRQTRQWFENERSLRGFLGEEVSGISTHELQDIFTDAVESKSGYTDGFTGPDISADSAIGGFDAKIVALISPRCVSACDGMAMLLKANGRAVLLGTPTSGTGAGFQSNQFMDTAWKDRYAILQSEIPNSLWGMPIISSVAATGTHRFTGGMNLSSENQPTEPDVRYETTLDDITQSNQGWIQTATALLNGVSGE